MSPRVVMEFHSGLTITFSTLDLSKQVLANKKKGVSLKLSACLMVGILVSPQSRKSCSPRVHTWNITLAQVYRTSYYTTGLYRTSYYSTGVQNQLSQYSVQVYRTGSLSPDEAGPAGPVAAGVARLGHGAEVRGLQLKTKLAELTHTLGLRHETEIKVNITHTLSSRIMSNLLEVQFLQLS